MSKNFYKNRNWNILLQNSWWIDQVAQTEWVAIHPYCSPDVWHDQPACDMSRGLWPEHYTSYVNTTYDQAMAASFAYRLWSIAGCHGSSGGHHGIEAVKRLMSAVYVVHLQCEFIYWQPLLPVDIWGQLPDEHPIKCLRKQTVTSYFHL